MIRQNAMSVLADRAVTIDERLALIHDAPRAVISTYKEAAAFLKIHRDTIAALVEKGHIVGVDTTDKRRCVLTSSLIGYLAARIGLPDKNEIPTRLKGSDRVAFLQAECTRRIAQSRSID